MAPPSPAERREELVRLVAAQGYLSTAELARRLDVTEMTTRRDIARLAADGVLRRVHGGASIPQGATPYLERSGAHLSAKRAIAAAAAGLLSPNSVVALDSGTTLALVAAVLPRDAGLTIVTHSVPAMAACAGRADLALIGLGGVFHHHTRSFAGPDTRRAIAGLSIDTLLLAASGVTSDGVHCGSPHDAEIKQGLIARARTVVLLADASKFGAVASCLVAPLTSIDAVVTDQAGAAAAWQVLEGTDVELTIAPEQQR